MSAQFGEGKSLPLPPDVAAGRPRRMDADSRWEKPMATGRQDPPTEAAQDGLFTVAGVAARTDQVLARSRELRARSRQLLAKAQRLRRAPASRRARDHHNKRGNGSAVLLPPP